MPRSLSEGIRIIGMRVLAIILGVGVVLVGSVYALHFWNVWYHTPFGFVAAFFLLILISNLLATLALVYIDA